MRDHKSSHHSYLGIKHYDQEDRPREKLIKQGKHTLTKAELLAIVINSGIPNANSIDLARQLLKAYNNNLNNLTRLSVQELIQFKGIGHAKAATIVGVLELANRLEKDRSHEPAIIQKPEDIYKVMKQYLVGKAVEEFWLMLLNKQCQVIKTIQMSKGGMSQTSVDVQLVLKASLLHDSSSIVLVHNHPSGSLLPSNKDIQMTKQVIHAAKTIKINVIDHLIFSDQSYFSFADEGLIDSLRL